MFSLFQSLAVLEKNNVLHKDIKPDNFLFNTDTKEGVLIDFGISYCELDESKSHKYSHLHSVLAGLSTYSKQRIGTRGFLAPEVIFNSKKQTTKIDVWSAGVIFLSFLAQKIPVFNLNSFVKINDETIRDLIPLIIVFGEEQIKEVAEMYDIRLYIPPLMRETFLEKGLEELVKRTDICEFSIDFLKKCLTLDYRKRISAVEALKHSFFNDVRETNGISNTNINTKGNANTNGNANIKPNSNTSPGCNSASNLKTNLVAIDSSNLQVSISKLNSNIEKEKEKDKDSREDKVLVSNVNVSNTNTITNANTITANKSINMINRKRERGKNSIDNDSNNHDIIKHNQNLNKSIITNSSNIVNYNNNNNNNNLIKLDDRILENSHKIITETNNDKVKNSSGNNNSSQKTKKLVINNSNNNSNTYS